MDIPCPRCGESWDIGSLHDEAEARMHGAPAEGPVYRETYEAVRAEFRRQGCEALKSYGAHCTPGSDPERVAVAALLHEVLGDDIDGIAVEMEDAELLGLFE